MTDQKPEKKSDRDWSTRVGTVKAGSIETFKTKNGEDALRALVVNAEGKESIIEAFSEQAQEKLNAAAASDKPMVFRGPAYFTEGNVPHVMIATVSPQGEPKAPAAEKTPEEIEAAKQARAEATAKRDASRVEVEAGTVGIGDSVEKDGASHEVNHIGATYEKGGKQMAYAYFGELGAEMAAKEAGKAASKDAEEDPSPM
jgi:hypothetical protein